MLQLRVARPVSDLEYMATLYSTGLGFERLGAFEDHDGFDGVMLGREGLGYHLEFTHCRTHAMKPSPTEDLLVFYVPDVSEWQRTCERMERAGFGTVGAFNPYWNLHGRTFVDPDGYRTVICRAMWAPA